MDSAELEYETSIRCFTEHNVYSSVHNDLAIISAKVIPGNRSFRVLIVDDSPYNLFVMKELLQLIPAVNEV